MTRNSNKGSKSHFDQPMDRNKRFLLSCLTVISYACLCLSPVVIVWVIMTVWR